MVRTEAGAYIKELVHGDLGRTNPSLTSLLGVPVDLIALDVTVCVRVERDELSKLTLPKDISLALHLITATFFLSINVP